MSISLKVRASIERSSWIRKMFEEGARLRAIHGEANVFDFTLGNPSVEPPEALHRELARLAANPQPGMHRYMNNAGYEETRAAVAEVVSEKSPLPLRAEHVIMTCGAGGALNVALKTILNPGEEVIILTPYFVEYKFYVDNHDGNTKEVWTDPATFQLDVPAIERAIGSNTRALIINSPNNPTGVVYPAASLQALGEMLERKQRELERTIFVISDEPYARLSYDGWRSPASSATCATPSSPPPTPRTSPCPGSGSATWRSTRPWRTSGCSWRGRSSATGCSASSMRRR